MASDCYSARSGSNGGRLLLPRSTMAGRSLTLYMVLLRRCCVTICECAVFARDPEKPLSYDSLALVRKVIMWFRGCEDLSLAQSLDSSIYAQRHSITAIPANRCRYIVSVTLRCHRNVDVLRKDISYQIRLSRTSGNIILDISQGIADPNKANAS